VNRRELLLTAALAPLLLSCSRVASAAADAATPLPDAAAISAAQHRLSRRVIDALTKDGATVVISPASIAGAFSVISAGASPELVHAIGAMLGFADTVAAADALAAVAKALGQTQGEAGALAIARALVLDPELKPSASTLSRLRAGEVEVIEAAFDNPETLKRINGWVAVKTKDLIPVLLDELPAQPGLVALDALYFKDRWKRQFEAGETSARQFHSAGGPDRTVQMMVSPEASWRFRKDEQFIAVDLGYQTDRFSLTIVTSRDKPLPASGFDAVHSWLGGEGFHELQGQVQLPKLALSGSHDLLGILDALGLAPARLQPKALAGFSDGELAISKVVQRVALKIDEQGTEAAAATGIVALRSLAAGEYVQMIVDKPFLFALRDAVSGLVLLSGYVADIPAAP
jgi:serine protease inhibitor